MGPTLEVELGIGAPPEKFPRRYHGTTERVALAQEMTITVREDTRHDYFESHAAMVGSRIWIRVHEGSKRRERALTESVLRGILEELGPDIAGGSDGSERGDAKVFRLRAVKGEHQFGSYEGISGEVNFGRPGTICHTVRGPKLNVALEQCRNGNAAAASWSARADEAFPFHFFAALPGPGDGEDYPWKHTHEIWFVPMDVGEKVLVATGESTQGRVRFEPSKFGSPGNH